MAINAAVERRHSLPLSTVRLPVLPRRTRVNRPLPVRAPQQSYDWFALIDRSVAHSQEVHFRLHLLRLSEHLDTCGRLVSRIDQKSVVEGGKCLQDASQKLLDEQDQLVAIGTTSEYFQELEYATRLLNHPGESLVLQTTLPAMYDPSRCNDAHQNDVSYTAQMHLLYTRFTTVAGQLAPLLECRAHPRPEELGTLLSECHAAYFGAQKNPLVSRLTEQRGLDPTRTELVELKRAGCSYLKQVCTGTERFDLYRAFREAGTLARTVQYLETLCDYPYDDLRPRRILHEPRLTVLCEVCTVLQALMVFDQPLDDEIEENEEKNDDLGRPH
ncbi:hypothetical protein BGW80DRAFT_1254625 [Lactifluus volemus]|nr:hypothetical protein BGW80DRAFT_1254625 [Lactifluus volemus]